MTAGSNIIMLAEHTGNGLDWTVPDMLRYLAAALEDDGSETAAAHVDGAIVLLHSNDFDPGLCGFKMAGMTTAEGILLCDLGKDLLKAYLKWPPSE